MKKLLACLLLMILVAAPLVSCSDPQPTETQDQDRLKVVSTIFPSHDWATQVLGDKAADAEMTLLIDSGVDLHSFQPTVEDIARISTCDVFIYVGGESDSWVEDALQNATNPNMIVVNLMDVLGDAVLEEELAEGMEDDHTEEGHEGDAHDEDAEGDVHEGDEHDEDAEDHAHEGGLDEHVWLSLRHAEIICNHLATVFGEADPANADAYQANADAYRQELSVLDEKYQTVVDDAKHDTLLFGDRFPFRYLVNDYGLNYYAAFAGCAAETEASFDTIIFLAEKMDELGLQDVIITESSDQSLASTIIQNTASKDQQILVMDSLQSTTSADAASGTTYLSVMEANLEVLRAALR